MIEGLKFVVRGSELKDHLQQRAIFHRQRVMSYKEQLDGVSRLTERAPETGNVIENLDKKIKEHRNAGDKFSFMADHVEVAQDYRLSDGDLVTVEFVSPRW